jgi:HK97 family phage portal protein
MGPDDPLFQVQAAQPAIAQPRAAFSSEDLRNHIDMGAGDYVSARDAMRNAAINRCVNLISGSMSQLPIQLMLSDVSGSGGSKAKDHPLYKVLAQKPNNWQSPSKFKHWMQMTALTKGNAYALPIRVGGKVTELIPLIKGTMRVEQKDDWSVEYIYKGKVKERTFAPSDIFHIMGPSDDGLTGVAMTDVARDTLSLARKSDASMRSMMDKGINPGGLLSVEGNLSEAKFEALKAQFAKDYGGAENSGKWIVGEQGLTAAPFASNGRDMQGVELRNQLVEEVSRFFGVPRPLMMMDDTSWGSGIEQLGIFYAVHCLGPWFIVWEEEIALKLLAEGDQEKYYAKVNERALLRGSMKDEGEYIAKLLGSGGSPQTIEQNEARGLLDMPAHKDGYGLSAGFGATGASQ